MPRPFSFCGMSAKRPHIGCHILAFGSVAAGGAGYQQAALIAQGQGKAVNLGLCGEFRRLVELQEAHHPVDEFGHVLVAEGVVE